MVTMSGCVCVCVIGWVVVWLCVIGWVVWLCVIGWVVWLCVIGWVVVVVCDCLGRCVCVCV